MTAEIHSRIHLDTVACIKALRALEAEGDSRITMADLRVGIETYLREAASNADFAKQMLCCDESERHI